MFLYKNTVSDKGRINFMTLTQELMFQKHMLHPIFIELNRLMGVFGIYSVLCRLYKYKKDIK